MSYKQNGMSKEQLRIIKNIFKRKSITHIGDDGKNNRSKIILITTKELKEINPIIKHPIIQTTLLDNKIEEMCKVYDESSKYHHFYYHQKPHIIINMKNYIIENKKNGNKLLKKSKI